MAFFFRQLFRIFRLFMVLLPITGIVYSFTFIALTIEIISGENVLSSMLPISFDSTSVKAVILETLSGYLNILSQYSGTLMYFVLFAFMLLLAVPLLFVFIAAGNFVYAGKYFIIFFLADMIFYLILYIVSGKSPIEIIKVRYRKYFPSIGRKLNERSYNKWLERHHDEFENDTFGQPKTRNAYNDFYREDDYQQYDDEYDEYLEEQYEEPEEYDLDEYEDEADTYYEDEYYDNPSPKTLKNQSTSDASFNFFAGCTTLDSANKKYKSLVKLYHPDNMDGDTSALQEINIQYNEIKKRLG